VAPAPTPAATPTPTPDPTPTPTPEPEGPAAKHVVVVSLTGQDAAHAFDPASTATYLAHDLPAKGTLLKDYRPVSSGSLANGLELLAGAGPAPDANLPPNAPSLPGELEDAARSWKTYVQGSTQNCTRSDRDPFTHIPALKDCGLNDVSLDAFAGDFTATDLAPSLAWIVPDACHDGSEGTCTDATDGPTGLARADAWLRTWVPAITGSKAFADDGLLVVLFDGGGLPEPAAGAERPAVGAVIVSRFTREGVVSTKRYDHLSLLRTLAGTFGVKPPGDAAGKHVQPLGREVFPHKLAATS
jgi:hypothetical protein